jgi:hypothetical protein
MLRVNLAIIPRPPALPLRLCRFDPVREVVGKAWECLFERLAALAESVLLRADKVCPIGPTAIVLGAGCDGLIRASSNHANSTCLLARPGYGHNDKKFQGADRWQGI